MNKNILELYHKLKKFNLSFSKDKNKLITKNNIYKSKFLYFYYFLMTEEFKESPYRNILINYFKKSENLYPGSSYFTSAKLLSNIILDTHNSKIELAENNLDNLFKYFEKTSNKDSIDLLRDVLYLSGPDAIINCKLTKNKEILVEKTCKPKYKIEIHPEFSSIYFNKVNSSTKSVRLSVFDGFVERESELIPFLEELKKENIPGVLICRGISEEAIKHLKNILLRNKIFLYPYLARFDNEDPFLLKDIAKMVDTLPVSGEFLDNVYEDILGKSVITKLTLEKESITFDKKNSELIDEINKQIKDCDQSVKEYLYKRKKRSSPNNITVYIPDNMINLLNELRSMIVCYNLCATRGFIYKDGNLQSKQCEEVSDMLSKGLFNTLNNIGMTIKLKG